MEKAQQFLQFLKDQPLEDLDNARNHFGLATDKADRSTDTIDLDLDIKYEYINSQNQGLNSRNASMKKFKTFAILVETLDEDSFNELEDFGEISTIALPDDDFAMSNDEIERNDVKNLSEAELSCEEESSFLIPLDSREKRDDDEMKLE